MNNRGTSVKRIYTQLAVLMQCYTLLFKNILLIRTLKVKSVSLYDRVIIQDNEVELLWNIKGCYKIKIKGIGVFPGDTCGLKFIFSNRYNPIEITFFGIARRIKKRILIDASKIDLPDKFMSYTIIPVVDSVPFSQEVLLCEFQRIRGHISNEKLSINLKEISIELDQFN